MSNTRQTMRSIFVFIATLAALTLSSPAHAIPTLQLDIGGGYYMNGTEQSVVTGADIFAVYALATSGGGMSAADILAETYYLSVSITPKEGPQASKLGSFTFQQEGGSVETVDVTTDMTYGSPPLTATANPYLGGHDIFDTFYIERSFTFNALQTVATYNVEDDAGASFSPGTSMYYIGFNIDMSLYDDSVHDLHFDLYSSQIKKNGEITLGDFAPFSHDASTVSVPEPSSAVHLAIGFFGFMMLCWASNSRVFAQAPKK